MAEKITSDDVYMGLEKSLGRDEWVLLREIRVPFGTSWRTADAIAVNCWKSRGYRPSLRNSDHCLSCTKSVTSNVRDIADALERINVEPCEHGVRIGGAKLQTTGVHNFLASGPPGKGADLSSGYEVGSLWIDIDVHAVWLCTRSSIGKSTWEQMGSKV